QVGEKSKSWSWTVCVGPLGVQLEGAFEPEHETAPAQTRTATRRPRTTRIGGEPTGRRSRTTRRLPWERDRPRAALARAGSVGGPPPRLARARGRRGRARGAGRIPRYPFDQA